MYLRDNGRRNSDERERQIERIDQIQSFPHFQHMMTNFSGFNSDMFMNVMMPFGLGFDPFQSIYQFSDLHKKVHEHGQSGSYYIQSYISSSKMGDDGQIMHENYFENNMGQHLNGNTISQKQQAYKNSHGVKKIAEERMLNNRGRKIVKEKKGDQVEETNHYYNIDEEDVHRFDQQWRQTDNNMNFLQNNRNYVQQQTNPQRVMFQYQTPPQITYQNYPQVRAPTQPKLQQQPNYQHTQKLKNRITFDQSRQVSYPQYQNNYITNTKYSNTNNLPIYSHIKFGNQ